MTYDKLNCLKLNCLIILLCVNKWLMFNWIVSDTSQYLELLDVWKQMINIE